VVHAFLAQHPEFALVNLQDEPLPAGLQPLLDDRGMFRTLPFRDGLEAFFAAALRRAG
jgi:16S rRNA C967 or C1407 C5-methylase (RsmB/RsmF family)